jgi:hypothetical protein
VVRVGGGRNTRLECVTAMAQNVESAILTRPKLSGSVLCDGTRVWPALDYTVQTRLDGGGSGGPNTVMRFDHIVSASTPPH